MKTASRVPRQMHVFKVTGLRAPCVAARAHWDEIIEIKHAFFLALGKLCTCFGRDL